MTIRRTFPMPLLFACLMVVSGCTSHLAEPPVETFQAQARSAFDEGVRLYEAEDYAAAEEQFLTPAIWAEDSSVQVQVQALKYLAFSYCLTDRPNQCRFAFECALQIDPSFHLKSTEVGHPLWGPVFDQAARH